MDSEAQVSSVRIRMDFNILLSPWMADITDEEYASIERSCKRAAFKAFVKQLKKCEEIYYSNKFMEYDGQTNIYDYV